MGEEYSEETRKEFVSTLIPLSETVTWEIHNVAELLKNNAWSAMHIPMEVGFGPTGLSRWEISLHSNGLMLQARAKLLTPSDGQKVTHLLTFKVIRNGFKSTLMHADSHKAKETAAAPWYPSFWKILPLEDLLDSATGLVTSDDTFVLILTLTVFGMDLSEK